MKNINHPRYERTLVILKPDAVQRGLVGEIIGRYERVGLKLAAMKMMVATTEMIHKHYMLDPEWMLKTGLKNIKAYHDKGLTPPTNDPLKQSGFILEKLKAYYTSGPIVLMIWEGAHAVPIIRKLTGGTEPLTSDVGTIRGDFVIDSYKMADDDDRSIRNLVHASGSVKEAQDEIGLWFSPKEILDYTLIQEKILYDVNLDGTPE
jgi:nucleoside-diphosphate kinase